MKSETCLSKVSVLEVRIAAKGAHAMYNAAAIPFRQCDLDALRLARAADELTLFSS